MVGLKEPVPSFYRKFGRVPSIASKFRTRSVRALGLLLVVAGVVNPSVDSAYGAQNLPKGAIVVAGECKSSDRSHACNLCEITLNHDLDLSAGDRLLVGSCPKMAAGRYSLGITIPVELIPAKSASMALFQLYASFSATAHSVRGYKADVLPETIPASWNWWDASGVHVTKTALIKIDEDAAIDVVFTVEDARYYVPKRTQGNAHRDDKLVIDKGEVIRLTRAPVLKSVKARDFSARTLAEVVPGHTTKAEVQALLGKPWRDTDLNDPNNPAVDIWEYRGQNSNGTCRIHIEFDYHNITTLIAKIPDKAGEAPARAEKAPPGPVKP